MKRSHPIQPQRLCVFCLHLARNIKPKPVDTRSIQRRWITSTGQHATPPAQATAQQENDDHDDYQRSQPIAPPQRPTPQRSFGAFAGEGSLRSRSNEQGITNKSYDNRRMLRGEEPPRPEQQLRAGRREKLASQAEAERESDRDVVDKPIVRYDGVRERPQIRTYRSTRDGDENAWAHLPRRRNAGTPAFSSGQNTHHDSSAATEQQSLDRVNQRESEARRKDFVGFRSQFNPLSSSRPTRASQQEPVFSQRSSGPASTPVEQPPITKTKKVKAEDDGQIRQVQMTKPQSAPSGLQLKYFPSEHSQESKPQKAADLVIRNVVNNMDGSEAEQEPQKRQQKNKSRNDTMPRTIDATPMRRGRERGASRRAEKFETTSSVFDDVPVDSKKQKKKARQKDKLEQKRAAAPTPIELPPFISVVNLATLMKIRTEDFVAKLEELGFEDIANDHVLNSENAGLVAMEYNFEPVADTSEVDDLKARASVEDLSVLKPRPPVVTIMGHVDHGKTTILDYLRKSSVAANEHGGITQHIGAFLVELASGKQITFLDTPGHAAFLSMRQRGANVTDIVVLVVAADDSVMPQTIEAIKHAKKARVPIIVAINKVDKPEADVQRVKTDLMRHEIEVEDFGGDIQAIQVSGKTGHGMSDLEEAAITLAEILDMKADYEGLAEGWILEATTKSAGRVATVLVKRGTLRPGDTIVAGRTWAKVRTLKNEAGVNVSEATPGTPVEVDGWREQPVAGDEVLGAIDEHKASDVVEYRLERDTRVRLAEDMDVINEQRRVDAERQEREKKEKEEARQIARETKTRMDWKPAAQVEDPNKPTDLYFIVKADVSGSAEAVCGTLESLPVANHKLNFKILRSGVGGVSESDVSHIDAVPAGNGFIVNFNQPLSPNISLMAERAGIRVFDENIIYKVLDNVKEMVEDRLPAIVKSKVTGEAEIAATFDVNEKKRTVKVAGCRVRNGIIALNKKVRVYRGEPGETGQGELVHDGTISSLKSHKKEVDEMRKGSECGIGFADWQGFRTGDVLQCYEEVHEKRRLM